MLNLYLQQLGAQFMASYWEPHIVQGFPWNSIYDQYSLLGRWWRVICKFFCLQNSWILWGGESSWKGFIKQQQVAQQLLCSHSPLQRRGWRQVVHSKVCPCLWSLWNTWQLRVQHIRIAAAISLKHFCEWHGHAFQAHSLTQACTKWTFKSDP